MTVPLLTTQMRQSKTSKVYTYMRGRDFLSLSLETGDRYGSDTIGDEFNY